MVCTPKNNLKNPHREKVDGKQVDLGVPSSLHMTNPLKDSTDTYQTYDQTVANTYKLRSNKKHGGGSVEFGDFSTKNGLLERIHTLSDLNGSTP